MSQCQWKKKFLKDFVLNDFYPMYRDSSYFDGNDNKTIDNLNFPLPFYTSKHGNTEISACISSMQLLNVMISCKYDLQHD